MPCQAAGPSGEKMSQRTGSANPAAAIHNVFRAPTAVPNTPPSNPPTGVIPHMMNRIVAFIRPSR